LPNFNGPKAGNAALGGTAEVFQESGNAARLFGQNPRNSVRAGTIRRLVNSFSGKKKLSVWVERCSALVGSANQGIGLPHNRQPIKTLYFAVSKPVDTNSKHDRPIPSKSPPQRDKTELDAGLPEQKSAPEDIRKFKSCCLPMRF
jgi:hypothetical protein